MAEIVKRLLARLKGQITGDQKSISKFIAHERQITRTKLPWVVRVEASKPSATGCASFEVARQIFVLFPTNASDGFASPRHKGRNLHLRQSLTNELRQLLQHPRQ